MIKRDFVQNIISIYKECWENQNSERIIDIFSENAIYHEKVLGSPYQGHEEIRAYWEHKVVKNQANIEFKLLSLFIDGNSAVAEWDVKFDDLEKKARKHMREVAIIEFNGAKIQHFREYWTSKILGKYEDQE
jgi:hypothetical protein